MSDVETRFRVSFTADAGAKYADAGKFEVYNTTQLSTAIFPGVEIGEGKASIGVYGLENVRRLRDLCETFLKSNQGDYE